MCAAKQAGSDPREAVESEDDAHAGREERRVRLQASRPQPAGGAGKPGQAAGEWAEVITVAIAVEGRIVRWAQTSSRTGGPPTRPGWRRTGG